MRQLLQIAVEQVPEAHVVSVVGEVDLSTAGQLEEAVLAVIDRATRSVVVLDLTAVTFLASNGISTLLQTKKHGETTGIELRIVVAPGSAARRSLDITGLLEILAGYPTLTAALAVGV